jgi:hypothetical protein
MFHAIIDRHFSAFLQSNIFREKTEKTITTTQATATDKEIDEPITYKNVVMSIYSPVSKSGPCRFIDGSRKQNHQCRRDPGLPDALREAKQLALTHCEEQFKFDRWNCSIETRGKRNIFKKVCIKLLPRSIKRILKDSNKYIP